jgi:cyclase
MRRTRVVPVLLLTADGLVKTTRFRDPVYVGDPINAVKILNDKGIDELIVLDIEASKRGTGPRLDHLAHIAEECFVPLCYGGGIRTAQQGEAVLRLGFEKVAVNTGALATPELVRDLARGCGSQSVVVAMDVKRNLLGRPRVAMTGGRGIVPSDHSPQDHARRMEELGAGELLVNSVERDGTGRGYDLELVRQVAGAVSVPVIACGGAGQLADFAGAVAAGASAVAAGQMFVFHGRRKAVLISYPSESQLRAALP